MPTGEQLKGLAQDRLDYKLMYQNNFFIREPTT